MKLRKTPKRIKLLLRSKNTQRLTVLLIISAITGLGIYLQSQSSAQGPYAVAQATNGSKTGTATTVLDNTAPNGSYVQFGSSNTLNNIISSTPQALAAPTHFDDTYWFYPSLAAGYTSISVDVTPEIDGSPDGYFFSTEFYFVNDTSSNNETGYLGIQTEALAGFTGKLSIFSIWGATSASDAQYTTTFTEGTSGWSARNSYPWVVGDTYALNMYYYGLVSTGEEWAATVTDKNTGVESYIGLMVVPSSYGLLSNETVTFHERYSGQVTSCSAMQPSEVEFTNPMLNGNVVATSHSNYIPLVTDSVGSKCQNYYGTIDIPGGIKTAIGTLPK